MPNKTIYLRQEDEHVWLRAKEVAIQNGTELSQVIVAMLAKYVAKAPICACGKVIKNDWKLCPYCGRSTKDGAA